MTLVELREDFVPTAKGLEDAVEDSMRDLQQQICLYRCWTCSYES